MSKSFASLKKDLKYLDIDVTNIKKCPNFTVIKKAFRKHLMTHPDKGGDTPWFQGLTAAMRGVTEYINNHPDNVEGLQEEKEEDTKLRKIFEDSTTLKHTTEGGGNICFEVKKDDAEQWLRSFDAYFAELKVVREQKGQGAEIYSDPKWEAPGTADTMDTLTVTVWPNSKNPKILIQGKHYMSFVTLILPKIAISMGKSEEQIKEIMNNEKEDIVMESEKETDPKNKEVLLIKSADKKNEEPSKDKTSNHQKELEDVNSTMKRLQEGVENRISVMVEHLEISMKLQKNAENKIEDLTEQVKSLNNKVDEVIVKIVKIDNTTEETSENVKELTSENQLLKKLEEGWKENNNKVDHLLKTVLSLEKHMHNLRSVAASSLSSKKETESESVEVIEVAKKKGIMFTSSVGMPLKLDALEEVTNSDIKKVKTFRVLENKTSEDPELHLNKMINKYCDKDKQEEDFVILTVGSNDIDDAMKKDDAMKAVEDQSERLVALADMVSRDINADVFVNEIIPRHDDDMKAELSNMANSYLHAKVANLSEKKVHVVRHGNLYRPEGKEREQLYRDSKHLTNWGLKLYSDNLIKTMGKVYSIKETPKVKPKVPEKEVPKEQSKTPTKWTDVVKQKESHASKPPTQQGKFCPQQNQYQQFQKLQYQQRKDSQQGQPTQFQQPQFNPPQFLPAQFQQPQYQQPQQQHSQLPAPQPPGFWSSSPSRPPVPWQQPSPSASQYHWAPGPQGHFSQGSQGSYSLGNSGGQYHFNSGQF